MSREVRTPVALRRRDIDDLGHVNQSVYHELLEEGRAALFAPLMEAGPWTFVLARVELHYRREMRLEHGTVTVITRASTIGRTSVTLEHAIELPDGSIAADGRAVLVAWDPETRASRPLSDPERALL